MATQKKLTIQLGGNRLQDVVSTAGTTTTNGDTIEINVDQNKMTKGDFINLLDKVKQYAIANKWPLA